MWALRHTRRDARQVVVHLDEHIHVRGGERSNGRAAQLCLTVIVVVVSDLDRSGGDLDLAGEPPDVRCVVLRPAISLTSTKRRRYGHETHQHNQHSTLTLQTHTPILEAQPAVARSLYTQGAT